MENFRTFNVKLKRGEDVAEFVLKEPLWIDDQAFQMQCTNQKGELVQKDLWLKRLEAATGKSSTEIMKLPHWQVAALQLKWLMLFDVNPGTFLEDLPEEKKTSSENSTSQKPGST